MISLSPYLKVSGGINPNPLERMSAESKNGVWDTLSVQAQLSKTEAESVPGW